MDKRGRIDRILTPSDWTPNIDECYPTFLAYSDHKALVLALHPRLFSPKDKRSFCPTTFLADADFMDTNRVSISQLDSVSLDWWYQAQSIIYPH